jgi:hypothetical protein
MEVLQEPTVLVGWEIGRALVLGKMAKILAHDSNRTTVFESILIELVRLVDEYVGEVGRGGGQFLELNEVWLEAWCRSCICQRSIHGHQFRSHWYGNKTCF